MDTSTRRVLGTLRALHHPVSTPMVGGPPRTMCGHCNTGDPYVTVSMDYPCPTLLAAERAAAGGPVEIHLHAVTTRWRPTHLDDVWVRDVTLLAAART